MNLPMLRKWWATYRTTLLVVAVGLMAVAAVHRLSDQFDRLLWEPGTEGAIDLKQRHEEVRQWFAGKLVYKELGHAVYPPASYVILWPLLGWLPVTLARWLWAVSSAIMLGWLAYLTARESKAGTLLEHTAAVLLPLSMYATSATIGNGQLIVHILPALLYGLTSPAHHSGWRRDLVSAALVVAALVSPTIAAPFFWIVLFVPGRLRPALLVVAGYLLLTLLALWFQEVAPITAIQDWSNRSEAGAAWGAATGGYGNLNTWMGTYGLQAWSRSISLLILGGLGMWVYCHRRGDLWLLLGVSAIVARVWVYHRLYDDLLILVPMIALLRIAQRGPSANGDDVVASLLLAFTWAAALAPASWLVSPPPWDGLFAAGQTIVWALVLFFLCKQAGREKSAHVAGAG